MALTKSYDLPRAERISRNVGIVTGKISFDSSYPTGGESLDLTDRLQTVLAVFIENKSGYIFEYDYTNKKVKAYYGNYDQTSDGALTEVANTTDLSSITNVRFVAYGLI